MNPLLFLTFIIKIHLCVAHENKLEENCLMAHGGTSSALCACAWSGVTPVTVDHPLCSLSLRRRSGLISSAYAVKWRASEYAPRGRQMHDKTLFRPIKRRSAAAHIPDCVTRPRCMPITLSTRLEINWKHQAQGDRRDEIHFTGGLCQPSTLRILYYSALKKAVLSEALLGQTLCGSQGVVSGEWVVLVTQYMYFSALHVSSRRGKRRFLRARCWEKI